MEENYILSVEGKQTVNGSSDKIDLKTRAAYMTKNGNRYITYTEYDVNNPKLTSRTTVKVSPDNVVTVMKGGTERHSLILEKGVRHKCEYITSFGIISLGVFTDTVNFHNIFFALKTAVCLAVGDDFLCGFCTDLRHRLQLGGGSGIEIDGIQRRIGFCRLLCLRARRRLKALPAAQTHHGKCNKHGSDKHKTYRCQKFNLF